jgi:hypothetical protein
MKRTVNTKARAIMLFLVAFTLFFWSCDKKKEQEEEPQPIEEPPILSQSQYGEVAFSFTPVAPSIGTPGYVRYVFKNAAGEPVTTILPLHLSEDKYVSEKQIFHPTSHTLHEYYIISTNHELLYAAVAAGAPLSGMVDETLPLSFNATGGQTTTVAPKVLGVTEERLPAQFGYASWGYKVNAKTVKFTLPVNASIATKIKSAELTITQSGHTITMTLTGPLNQLSADVLVKPNIALQISLIVTAENVYSHPLNGQPNTDTHKSISQIEFVQNVPPIENGQFTFTEFRHGIGNGWTFKFAELTAYGTNGSWMKVKYQGGELCSHIMQVSTNASVFSGILDAGKFLSAPTGGFLELIRSQLTANTHPRVCNDGICTFTVNVQPANTNFDIQCENGVWIGFDSFVQLTTTHNAQNSTLSIYFFIERE